MGPPAWTEERRERSDRSDEGRPGARPHDHAGAEGPAKSTVMGAVSG
ncbi:hypothetical protein EV652_101312 [Kribbella steppae]|uniref:Uncharacterized protein n=1 Tax=Kribbella steppae TaxID=2512223 RepID=A0A4R2HVL3_9ACTN|nr:hypothetical protein EV652_101312 [Kribbella steppae]